MGPRQRRGHFNRRFRLTDLGHGGSRTQVRAVDEKQPKVFRKEWGLGGTMRSIDLWGQAAGLQGCMQHGMPEGGGVPGHARATATTAVDGQQPRQALSAGAAPQR